MSNRFKPKKKIRKPRSEMVMDMLEHNGGGFHSDKRDRRGKRANEWKQDLLEDFEDK